MLHHWFDDSSCCVAAWNNRVTFHCRVTHFMDALAYPLLPPVAADSTPGDVYQGIFFTYNAYVPPEPTAPPAEGWHSHDGVVEAKYDDISPSTPQFIEHAVMQSDTLQGLCIRYKVTLRELKRWNQFPRVRRRMITTNVTSR